MTGKLRNVFGAAGSGWVAVTFVLPVVAALVVSGLGDVAALNLVHVATGVLWIGAAVYVTAILGPALLSLDPELRGQVLASVIPRTVVLVSGVAIAALLTGPMLAVSQGRWDLGDPLMALAVVVGLALLGVGLYLVRVQVLVHDELTGAGPPDPQRMGALGGKIGRASPVMLALQLTILLVMVLLRAPGSL